MPCQTPFNGSTNDASTFQINTRPRGWIGELEKMKTMEMFRLDPDKRGQKSCPIRFRHISSDVVSAQQVIKDASSDKDY